MAGPGDEVLTGFYNSRYIASDYKYGHLINIDGAYVGNVNGLGFTVKYTKSDGEAGEFPVTFNTTNFTIPAYGLIKSQFAASELFVSAYNLAVQETVDELEYTSEPINPFTVRADFMININLNLNAVHPGSLFNGGANAKGNFPATSAQWLP
jgi:hypothetical protein